MNRKALWSQYFKVFVAHIAAVLCLLAGAANPVAAQAPKPSLPDPVKFIQKFDIVWNVVRAVYDEMGYSTELEDKKGGRIVTKPYEFITGTLTSSEIEKAAVKQDTITGEWLKARYTVETLVEIVTPTQTLVTVRTRIEGLHRELGGQGKWVTLQSLGTIEKRILGRISMKLIGDEMQFNDKKGFWDRSPQSPDNRPRRPSTPSPR